MRPDDARAGLRSARAGRGWSQTDAARALTELAGRRGVAVAAAASLKTQLSRWENGHATPEAPYRGLLGELYGATEADLGLAPARGAPDPDPGDPVTRLRTDLATANAVDDDVLALWTDQLAVAQELDDRLGGAGAAEAVRALLTQLESVLPHVPDPPRRRAVAALLGHAALLAGTQALDAGAPDAAVRHWARAAEVAREAGRADLVVAAAVRHAAALAEIGETRAARDVLAHAPPGAGPGAVDGPDRTHPPAGVVVEIADEIDGLARRRAAVLGDPIPADRLTDALAAGPRAARDRAELHAELSRALAGAGEAEAAAEHARSARTLALRIGSRRLLGALDDQPGASPEAGPTAPSSSSAAL